MCKSAKTGKPFCHQAVCVQAVMQQAGADLSLHEVITLARAWSVDGSVVPVKHVLACFAPSSEVEHDVGQESWSRSGELSFLLQAHASQTV